MAEITWLDALVGVVLIASAAYATWKGLLRESLSIFAWAFAAYAAIVFGSMLRSPMREIFSPEWLGDVVAYAGIFVLVLVPLSFLSFRFSESIQKSPIGPVDRSLGLVFGIGRGLVLVALPYIAFTMLVPIKDQPEWIKSAATLPLIQRTSDVLLSLVPDQRSREERRRVRVRERGRSRPAETAANPPATRRPATTQSTAKPAPKPAQSQRTTTAGERQKTYGTRERRALDRLIETTGEDGSQTE
jgi:membrane protein required for colicin V production